MDEDQCDLPRYWPTIDDALRRAMYDQGVHVKLMTSYWSHTHEDQVRFISSLAAINGTSKGSIEVVGGSTTTQQIFGTM